MLTARQSGVFVSNSSAVRRSPCTAGNFAVFRSIRNHFENLASVLASASIAEVSPGATGARASRDAQAWRLSSPRVLLTLMSDDSLCRVSISQAGWGDPTYDVASFCLVCDLS